MTNEQPMGLQGERIDALLAQMRMLCSQIDSIGIEQQQLLDDDKLEEFVGSLTRRNPKIESLSQAGVLVERFLGGDDVAEGQVLAARARLDEMSVMVEGILKRDAEQLVFVERRRGELAKQLSGVGTARSAMRAYSGGDQTPNPTLQDREG